MTTAFRFVYLVNRSLLVKCCLIPRSRKMFGVIKLGGRISSSMGSRQRGLMLVQGRGMYEDVDTAAGDFVGCRDAMAATALFIVSQSSSSSRPKALASTERAMPSSAPRCNHSFFLPHSTNFTNMFSHSSNPAKNLTTLHTRSVTTSSGSPSRL
jgi:hypothetical protein